MPAFRRLTALLLLTALAPACDDEGPDPAALGTVASMTLRPAHATIEIGQRVKLTAVLHDAEGEEITERAVRWSSSNPDVAVVESGLVTGVDDGVAEITATADGRSAGARITVQLVVTEVRITPDAPSIATGTSVQLMATPLSPDGVPLDDRVVDWRSLHPRIAVVSVGKVRGLRPGTADILAIVDDESAMTTVSVLPNVSGRWTLTTTFGDPGRGIACTGAGPLTITQDGAMLAGLHQRTGTCRTPAGTVSLAAELALGDASLSPAALDFLLTGRFGCAYRGAVTGIPAATGSGEVTCSGEIEGEPVTMSGTWAIQR